MVCSYRMSTFIEPEAVFNRRQPQAEVNPFAFTAADPHIFSLLRGGPQRITSIVNRVGRILPSTSKRQRIEIKRLTMIRIGELIRRGKLRRIDRIFVGLMVVHVDCKLPSFTSGFRG